MFYTRLSHHDYFFLSSSPHPPGIIYTGDRPSVKLLGRLSFQVTSVETNQVYFLNKSWLASPAFIHAINKNRVSILIMVFVKSFKSYKFFPLRLKLVFLIISQKDILIIFPAWRVRVNESYLFK